jgi:pyruvate/2-oxoglutarate dehydrogenase complex dihydrolipoamide acyltransferase (E2) component
VHLSRVKLDIKGVEAELVLKARLEHVAAIVDRLMTSLDRNPELVKGLSRAVSDIGQGAADAVDKTGDAAKDVGEGAQSALQDVGKGAGGAVGDVGEGAGHAVGDVGEGAGHAVGDVGEGAGQAVGSLARSAGDSAVTTPGDVAKEVARKVRNLGGRRDQRRAEKHHATQTATRVASELGVDLERLEGTGIDGRITVKDVREAQKA